MNSYDLSRNFWNWAFENPEIITPNHAAIYFFALEHCNRLGGKEKFGFPSLMTMEAIGIKKHQTYIKYFNDLVELGFFKLIQKSQNQYSANIISINIAMPKKGKALDKAFIKHKAKQTETNGQSKDYIDKQVNKETNKQVNKETKVYSDEVHNSFNNCLSYFPEHLHPKNKESWLDTIEKLNRIDGIPFNQIEHIVKKTRDNDFWSKNFLSITKLRKKNKDDIMFVVVFNEQIKEKAPKSLLEKSSHLF